MGTYYSPSIITSGLVFNYDMGNTAKSWFGQPTTNLLGETMSIYNNVPSDVSAVLEATTEKYMGATVYKQTLTPLTATGVSYLTGGNNPGIGVVTGGGGGTANRYTGFSIFYRPTVPMNSSPIFTSYSNIPGWQSGGNYNSMGNGWFGANVIWYDTVTRSDGKYWAINPATATLNVPIVVYWAGPFKEDRNDSSYVSQYAYNSRSVTQAIIDIVGKNTVTATSLTYNNDGTFRFDGTGNSISLSSTLGYTTTVSAFAWIKTTGAPKGGYHIVFGGQELEISIPTAGEIRTGVYTNARFVSNHGSGLTDGNWHYVGFTFDGSIKTSYIDGKSVGTQAVTGTLTSTMPGRSMGIFGQGDTTYGMNGYISVAAIYSNSLTATEVYQNFNALRGRYNV